MSKGIDTAFITLEARLCSYRSPLCVEGNHELWHGQYIAGCLVFKLLYQSLRALTAAVSPKPVHLTSASPRLPHLDCFKIMASYSNGKSVPQWADISCARSLGPVISDLASVARCLVSLHGVFRRGARQLLI